MINEEFKEKYSDELINEINSFEEDSVKPQLLNEYSEKAQALFWDDCFNLCQEEKVNVDKICRFAFYVTDQRSNTDKGALFGFYDKLAGISEEFATKTLNILRENCPDAVSEYGDHSKHYLANILKKYPKTFFEFSDSIINMDPVEIDIFTKIIYESPELAPNIFSYLDNKMGTPVPFGEKGSRGFHSQMFKTAKKIAEKHPEFNSELQSLLHKTVEIPLSDNAYPRDYARKFAFNLLEYDIRDAFPLSELIKYQNNLVNNSGMTAGAFATLLTQIDFKERMFPEFAEQLRASMQVIIEKMDTKIKNGEISAVDSLPCRWNSEQLYKTIFEQAEKEIIERKYNDISMITSQAQNRYHDKSDQEISNDTFSLLKLTDKVLDNVSAEKFSEFETNKILDARMLRGVKSLPEARNVIYSVLDKAISLNKKNTIDYAHDMFTHYTQNDVLPVADLMKLSEKVIKVHTDIEGSKNISEEHLKRMVDFYQLATDKDPSQAKMVFTLLEKSIPGGDIKKLPYDIRRNINIIYSNIVKTTPDLVPEAVASFSKLNSSDEKPDFLPTLIELSKDWIDNFENEDLTREKAQNFLLVANELMIGGRKELSTFTQNFKRISIYYPEYTKEALVILNKNKHNYHQSNREIINETSKEILSHKGSDKAETLSYVLNGLKNNKDNLVDLLAEYAESYPNPKEFFKILKENINLNLLDKPKAVKVYNTLLSRTPDIEPEIKNLIPTMEKIALSGRVDEIYNLYATSFVISKDISYLNSLKCIEQKFEENLDFFSPLVVNKILNAASTPESARVIMEIMDGKANLFANKHGKDRENAREVLFQSCETIVKKKLLPASEVCEYMFNIIDRENGELSFKRLCQACGNIRLMQPKTETKILDNLTQIYKNKFSRTYYASEHLTAIVKTFGPANEENEAKKAAEIVLKMDQKFDFLKAYIDTKNDSKIFYHLDSKIGGKLQYLDILFRHIDDYQMYDGEITKDLIIKPIENFTREIKHQKDLRERSAPVSSIVNRYEEYSYLNEPGSNLKDRSFIGNLDKAHTAEEIDENIIKPFPMAAFNMANAAVRLVGSTHGKDKISELWMEMVLHFPEDKQTELYLQFEDQKELSYKFVLYMALSNPEMWKKYGEYLEDADGQKGLENNPIDTKNVSIADIFVSTIEAWEKNPDKGDKLEHLLRQVIGDNITDLYLEHKDLFKQFRHPVSSCKRLLESTDSKAANFLDVFTEKMKDIAREPEFAGNRDWNCLSEAMNNNPKEFNERAQETFNKMLEEKGSHFSSKPNNHNNSFARDLFPNIANKVDNIAKKVDVADIEECIEYEKRYHKCAVGLYQHDKELIASLKPENVAYRTQISKKIVSDMANCGIDNVYWAMNTVHVFKSINGRPETYNSSYNDYPVEVIAPYSKVNMPVWMYKVAIDNELPHQRMGSVINLFDKCKAVKRAPHLASWGTEARKIGKMPLWYQVVAGAITKKLHQDVSDHEWKHNLELRELFWQEMKSVQEMGYVKAMQTYIEGGIEYEDDGTPKRNDKDCYVTKNIETRQAISALLENKKIEGSKENYHATIDKLAEKDAFGKIFAKEGNSKKLCSKDLLKAHRIIEIRKELQKTKSRKQKLNIIRDAHSGENIVPVDDVTVTVTPIVENKIAAMRRELLKAKGKC